MNTPQLIKHKDAVYTFVDGGVLKGYTKRGVDIPDGTPWIGWYGAKLPHNLWVQILAFFAWTYDTGKDESLVHLYYNESTQNWIVWAPPQRGIGMTVKTIDDDPAWAQAEAFIGYIKVGTVHHHCSGSAFQSGTDSADESTTNGIHITVGHMDKTFHDLHSRAVFNGNMIEVGLRNWIELAPKYASLDLPPELLDTAYDYSLKACAPKDATFPDGWKSNFHRSYSYGNTSYAGGHTTGGYLNGGSHVSVIGPKREAAALTSMSGAVKLQDGREGYWSTVNGVSEFIETGKDQKKTISLKTLTPAERGELEIEDLLVKGLPFLKLQTICETLKGMPRNTWASDDKDTMAVVNILNRRGLNPGWLQKWIDVTEWVEQHGYDPRDFHGDEWAS